METSPPSRPENFEHRLDGLREEARTRGAVAGAGVRAAGGPLPAPPAQPAGYFGLPVLKPPVWKWMIGTYFFVGGLAGMAALIAAAARWQGDASLARFALGAAAGGAVLSPILLIWDLGRPRRFLNMLRVFKLQSPMSLGSWIVSGFGGCAIPGWLLSEWNWHRAGDGPTGGPFALLTGIFTDGAAFFGIFLATYTGALIAVSAVPAWHRHRVLLPLHFGLSGLGSAAGLAELAGFHPPALRALLLLCAAAETAVLLRLELGRRHAADRPLHAGRSGWILRAGEVLEGPLALGLVATGAIVSGAAAYLLGALVSRFGWLTAGRASALDPTPVLGRGRM